MVKQDSFRVNKNCNMHSNTEWTRWWAARKSNHLLVDLSILLKLTDWSQPRKQYTPKVILFPSAPGPSWVAWWGFAARPRMVLTNLLDPTLRAFWVAKTRASPLYSCSSKRLFSPAGSSQKAMCWRLWQDPGSLLTYKVVFLSHEWEKFNTEKNNSRLRGLTFIWVMSQSRPQGQSKSFSMLLSAYSINA